MSAGRWTPSPISCGSPGAEQGGPAVRQPQRNGFGRLLIERVLASDLKGDVRMDFAEDGLKCVISVPLSIHLPATEVMNFLLPAQ